MQEKCDSCQNQTWGCSMIQKMNTDIKKLKNLRSNMLHYFSWCIMGLASLVVLAWAIHLLYQPKGQSIPNITISLHGYPPYIQNQIEGTIQKLLHEAYIQVEKNAAEAYDKNFTTLLTILTIFGIAWPVIIALLQFKFSENELKKIDQANQKVETVLSFQKEFQQSFAQKDSTKALLIQYRIFSQIYYDMGCDKKKADASTFGIFNHYFAEALEFKLRAFLLDERNVTKGSITHILNAFDISQPSSDKNITCRDGLTTCKAIAGEVMRNAHGTVREKEAVEVWATVVQKYNQFGGSPIDGEDD